MTPDDPTGPTGPTGPVREADEADLGPTVAPGDVPGGGPVADDGPVPFREADEADEADADEADADEFEADDFGAGELEADEADQADEADADGAPQLAGFGEDDELDASGAAEGAGALRPTIDPRIRQRRLAIRRSQGRRRLRWIGGVAVAVVVVLGLVGLAHTPWFGAQAVTVTGTHPHTPDAAIVAAAGLQGHPPLISVDTGTVARRVEALPFIATARVRRHWPDGVQIAVTERVPVVEMAGPGSSWSLLDGHGRTLQVVPGRLPGLVVYIVHTATAGIPPAPLGDSLPAAAGPGLEVSRTLPPAFSAQVVSVTVAADGSISLALDSGITVLFGTDSDRTAKYQDIASILAHGTLHATSVIDVTVPESPTVSG